MGRGTLEIMPQIEHNLIWIDLEMTGLRPDADRIIEIATVITNPRLETLAEGPVFAIRQARSLLEAMDPWNTKHHAQSGLTRRVEESAVSEDEAEQRTLEFLRQWVPEGKSPMCGNSVCQDRRFLARWMPRLEDYFHYRSIDVSTIKELMRLWYPKMPRFEKQGAHLALDDIRDSIGELHYYRSHLFVAPEL
jgi:oligoribonuclease